MKHSSEMVAQQQALIDDWACEERIYRILASDIVERMPIDELHKLFKFEKIDPNSNEGILILNGNGNENLSVRSILRRLRENKHVRFMASIDVDDVTAPMVDHVIAPRIAVFCKDYGVDFAALGLAKSMEG